MKKIWVRGILFFIIYFIVRGYIGVFTNENLTIAELFIYSLGTTIGYLIGCSIFFRDKD